MRIDLHAHSTASDGTLHPGRAGRGRGATAGLDVVAITDHDTTGGWAAGRRGAAGRASRLVRGAELSCRWYGVEPAIPLHLLAYLFDPTDAGPGGGAGPACARPASARGERIVELPARRRRRRHLGRGARVRGRRHGRAAAHRAGADPGRAGARPPTEAFAPRWLGERYRLPKDDIDVFAARRGWCGRPAGCRSSPIRGRPAAGRVVPGRADRRDWPAPGLFGLEADHEDHSPAERAARAGAGRRAGPGRHRLVGLPRHPQDGAARRAHDRAGGVRADRGRGRWRDAGVTADPGRRVAACRPCGPAW